MINFRYHIISITAVFLALGLGLALGTSFGNRALVSSLQTTQRSLDKEVKEKRATNSRLQAEAAQAQERSDRFEQQAVLGPLLAGKLAGVPVLLIAPTGIDDQSLTLLRSALATSGADFAGTLRLDRRLILDGDNAAKVAAILGVPATTPRAELRRELVRELATTFRAGAQADPGSLDGTTSTTAPGDATPPITGAITPSTTAAGGAIPTTVPDGSTTLEPQLITELRQGGFLQLEPPENGDKSDPIVLNANYRYLFVSGPGADVPDDDLLLPLVRALGADSVPIVVASAAVGNDPESTRTTVVGPIRADSKVNQSVSTVDDLESFDGIAATILAVQETGAGRRGHYGVGDGATAPLPPVPNQP